MRTTPPTVTFIAACAALATLTSTAAAQSATSGYDVQRIADGVYALIRTDPPGLMFEANAAFIVDADDVIVIDGGSNPQSAREVLAALRAITSKPVRYVINTHWHDDHMMGNEVYRDAFPAVDFIAHSSARPDMETDGVTNRKGFLENGPATVTSIRSMMERSQGMDGQALTEEERTSHLASIALAEKYMAQAPNFRVQFTTIPVEERLRLARGERIIEIRWLGRAHTRGDIVVHLPREGIVFTGDIVAAPVPLIGSTSFPLEFGATIEAMLGLHATTFVPGHGPVMRDDSYPRLVARMLASIRQQAGAAVARGETLEQVRKSVDLDEFRKAIAGDGKVANLLFANYVAGPAVARAFEHASAPRQQR